MKKFALPEDKNPSDFSARSALEAVLRDGARKMLQNAIENEVLEYIPVPPQRHPSKPIQSY